MEKSAAKKQRKSEDIILRHFDNFKLSFVHFNAQYARMRRKMPIEN